MILFVTFFQIISDPATGEQIDTYVWTESFISGEQIEEICNQYKQMNDDYCLANGFVHTLLAAPYLGEIDG